jgi:hypothetical protein
MTVGASFHIQDPRLSSLIVWEDMRLGSSLLVASLGASLAAACYLGEPPPPPEVGPAPLRRLTNTEYLDALADLFPNQSPTLPPLPADAILGGFDNAAVAQEPSDVAIARYEAIANAYAAGATSDDASTLALTGCGWRPPVASACATKFITTVGRRVYRRPLATDEIDRLLTKFAEWQTAIDFRAAVRLTLAAMLQSPQFVYRAEPLPEGATGIVPVERYALASRLSFLLWASTPDDALLDAAASGELSTEEGVRAQATRMLADDRTRRALWNFHRQWLALDLVLTPDQATRTTDIDPGWTPKTQISAERETELFVENTLMSGGTLGDLLLSSRAWIDEEMARVYHLPAPSDPSSFAPVDLSPGERAGLLTRAAFLAGTSHAGGTSPPIRGYAVQLRLFCELPLSPPPGANLSMPTAPPSSGPQTTRMLFDQRTSPPACQSCHASLNGIGYGFEHYDAAGAYRASESGLPIDATGNLTGTDVDGAFDGALELSAKIAQSHDMHRCATQQWLRYALGRAVVDAEGPTLDRLASAFDSNHGDVRALLVSIATSQTFRFRKAGE